MGSAGALRRGRLRTRDPFTSQGKLIMKTTRNRLLFVLLLALTLGLAGCATTKEVEQLRSDVKQAMDRAASAEATANSAQQEAAAARAAAERAEQASMDAKAAAEATDEKIDRMFKKTMNK